MELFQISIKMTNLTMDCWIHFMNGKSFLESMVLHCRCKTDWMRDMKTPSVVGSLQQVGNTGYVDYVVR